MTKTRGLLQDALSNAAEINEYKQKIRDAQSSVSDLQQKLQQKERELTSAKEKVATLEKETEKQTADWKAKLEAAVEERLAGLQQELDEEKKSILSLKEQLEKETADLRKKLSAKDLLIEAKEKMLIKLVTTKSESLQKKESVLKQQVKEAQACAAFLVM